MMKNNDVSQISHYAKTALNSLDNKSLAEVRGMLEGIIDITNSDSINSEFNFWVDATTFIKTILVPDAEQLFIDHIKKRGFNENETQFFRSYLEKAFDMIPMMAYLKMKCDEQK